MVMFNSSLTARRSLNMVLMHELQLICAPIMQFSKLRLAVVFGVLV